MDLKQSLEGTAELVEAQSHIYRHVLSYANSMSLSCALELGIPDIIHDHGKPITLQELVSKLNIPVEKTLPLQQLMRLLIHFGFFSITKFCGQEGEDEKEGYVLTLSSKLLLNNNSEKGGQNLLSLLPYAKMVFDPVLVTPWQFLSTWFLGSKSSAFEAAHGVSFWEFADKNSRFNGVFNDAMASNSKMVNLVVKDTKEIFEGVDSLVDVGGGTGVTAKVLLEAFPHMNCIVFDLPHVVADMKDTTNLKYIGGDMFNSIPSADAVLFKHVFHNWSDEKVLKILKQCKKTIRNNGNTGKVIIIDTVVDENLDRHEIKETKLVFDVFMMLLVSGRERTKNEWEKLVQEAGFNRYKIYPIFGLRSLIEVFP